MVPQASVTFISWSGITVLSTKPSLLLHNRAFRVAQHLGFVWLLGERDNQTVGPGIILNFPQCFCVTSDVFTFALRVSLTSFLALPSSV